MNDPSSSEMVEAVTIAKAVHTLRELYYVTHALPTLFICEQRHTVVFIQHRQLKTKQTLGAKFQANSVSY